MGAIHVYIYMMISGLLDVFPIPVATMIDMGIHLGVI